MTDHEPVIKWLFDLRSQDEDRRIPTITHGLILRTDTEKLHFLTKWQRLCLWAGFTDVKTLNEKYRQPRNEMKKEYVAVEGAKFSPNEVSKSMTIGNFVIHECDGNWFWIQHENGEGMQTSKSELEEMLHKFWAEQF
jgi:hypothetical protein